MSLDLNIELIIAILALLVGCFATFLAWQSGKATQSIDQSTSASSEALSASLIEAVEHGKDFKARTLLHIATEWNRVLPKRYALIQVLSGKPVSDPRIPLSKEDLSKAKGYLESPQYQGFFDTNFWRVLREVLNFYEFLGILIEKGYVEKEAAFKLVSVDYFGVLGGTPERVPPDQGDFYKEIRIFLEYLRKHYRDDIYRSYDETALVEYHAYITGTHGT